MLDRYEESSEYEKFLQPIADDSCTSKYSKCEFKRYNSNFKEKLRILIRNILTIRRELK